MTRELSPAGCGFVFILALLVMALVGNWHYADALTDEAIEKEARPARVLTLPSDEPQIVLTTPLACEDQWISKQLPDGRWRVSCVVADLRSVK